MAISSCHFKPGLICLASGLPNPAPVSGTEPCTCPGLQWGGDMLTFCPKGLALRPHGLQWLASWACGKFWSGSSLIKYRKISVRAGPWHMGQSEIPAWNCLFFPLSLSFEFCKTLQSCSSTLKGKHSCIPHILAELFTLSCQVVKLLLTFLLCYQGSWLAWAVLLEIARQSSSCHLQNKLTNNKNNNNNKKFPWMK